MSGDPLVGNAKPRLLRGVRLYFDKIRDEWTLLGPERLFKTDAVAVEILKRCTGERSLAEIVDDLTMAFAADRARVDTDVRALLAELIVKRMMTA